MKLKRKAVDKPKKRMKKSKKRVEEENTCLFAKLPPTAYKESLNGVEWIVPMTAKEPLNEKDLNNLLNDENVIAEDKLDGVRQEFHINPADFNGVRLFSRRVSKKTDWLVENTDLLPQFRDLKIDLGYTILDGELKVLNKPFSVTSGILNSLPEEAWERQNKNKMTFNAFDIIWYDGENVQDKTLWERKKLLEKVVRMIDNKYVISCEYFTKTIDVILTDKIELNYLGSNDEFLGRYPALHEKIRCNRKNDWDKKLTLNKQEYYEYVLADGGEGIMLKPLNGTYKQKKCREYTKYKKYLTRDVIIVDYGEPKKEYTGKSLKTWGYWVDFKDKRLPFAVGDKPLEYAKIGYTPVTQPYYYRQIGKIKYGVIVEQTDVDVLKKTLGKKFSSLEFINMCGYSVLVCGDCSGFSDLIRADFTDNGSKYIGEVIEVGCNEVFKNTGALRNPRFLRNRPDKGMEDCLFSYHVNTEAVVSGEDVE